MTHADSIIADPTWFPHRYEPDKGTILFVRLNRKAHRDATFIDDQYLSPSLEQRRLPIALLRSPAPVKQAPIHFIFHSAFCCSTLLTRAFDVPGLSFGLKEPRILNDLAVATQRGQLSDDLFGSILSLLARPLSAGETIIVKPSNEANALIEPILRLRTDARALCLSSALDDFLLSVAKKGMWGRLWCRRLYAQMRPRQRLDPGFSSTEVFQQTDLQIAALVWLMHRSEFVSTLTRFPAQTRSLDSADLLRGRERIVQKTASLFSIQLLREHSPSMASLFNEHSKERGRSYDAGARSEEQAAARAAHGEEIAMVSQWAFKVAEHLGLPMALPASLVAGADAASSD